MRRIKIKKSVLLIILLGGILLFRSQLVSIFDITSNFRDFINFKLVKVKSKIYKVSENAKGRVNDALYVNQFVADAREDNLELQILKLKNLELNQEKSENERLRNLLELKSKADREYIAAEVILLESFNSNEKIYLNKGSKDNVEMNMPVIGDGFLIGRIIKVSDDYSEVMLLTSKDSRLSVLINGQETGILRGTGTNRLTVENYNGDVEAEGSDILKITTSGISDIFPGNIYVGTYKITDILTLKKNKEFSTKPSFNVYNLKEVVVYKINDVELLNERIKREIEAQNENLNNNKETNNNGGQ